MPQEIIIDISEAGDVRVEGKGFSGPDCKAFTKGLEEALGDVTRTELKPEYRQARAIARKQTA